MTPDELSKVFWFDPSTPRAMGAATNAALVVDKTASAVAATFQLLDREKKEPTDKWLWLQLQPRDAIALAATILDRAKEAGWPLPPDLASFVEHISMDKTGHH